MVKKNKSKKVLSPSHSNMPDQPPPTDGDGELMDDLLAELDSRDKTVQHESANVLMEMQENQENAVADKAQSATKKQDSKSRHVARQVSIRSRLFVITNQHSADEKGSGLSSEPCTHRRRRRRKAWERSEGRRDVDKRNLRQTWSADTRGQEWRLTFVVNDYHQPPVLQ
jgi:hypothetical protein